MSSLQRVRPIKTELIRLRRRRSLALKVKEVLSERLVVLTSELLARVNEAKALRKRALDSMLALGMRHQYLRALFGASLDYLTSFGGLRVEVEAYTENLLGVKVPVRVLRIREPEIYDALGLSDHKQELEQFLVILSDLLRAESSIRKIAEEIKKTKRKVNALEYIVIPNLTKTIKAISMKFDEKEREEKARLKRIKKLMESRKK